jgi:hypothetical protein
MEQAKKYQYRSTKGMQQLYFAGSTDDLLPSSGEVFLVATVQAINSPRNK